MRVCSFFFCFFFKYSTSTGNVFQNKYRQGQTVAKPGSLGLFSLQPTELLVFVHNYGRRMQFLLEYKGCFGYNHFINGLYCSAQVNQGYQRRALRFSTPPLPLGSPPASYHAIPTIMLETKIHMK